MKYQIFGISLLCFILSGCATTPPGTGEQERGAEDSARYLKYVVQKGDTFWKISQMAYNDSRKWRKIYDANSDRVKDIAQLTPGDIIIIPIEKEEGGER